MDLRTLTLISYDEETEDQSRVTLAPHNIDFVIGSVKDYPIQGRQLKKVNVFFSDGNNIELYMSDLDLHQLESAIGTYDVSPY